MCESNTQAANAFGTASEKWNESTSSEKAEEDKCAAREKIRKDIQNQNTAIDIDINYNTDESNDGNRTEGQASKVCITTQNDSNLHEESRRNFITRTTI